MPLLEVLILKFLSVDRFPSRALQDLDQSLHNASLGPGTYVASCKVPALKHEIRNYTMKFAPSISEAMLSGTQGRKVLDSLWDDIVVQLEDDAALLF